MNQKVFLFIEDDETIQCMFSIIANRLGLNIFQATSISEAAEIFYREKDQITHIYIDGCVPGRDLNTVDLVQKIRTQFTGKIFAMSNVPRFNEILVDKGCDGIIENKALMMQHLREVIKEELRTPSET